MNRAKKLYYCKRCNYRHLWNNHYTKKTINNRGKYNYKKNNYKKKKRSDLKSIVIRGVSVVPDRLFTKLLYDTQSLRINNASVTGTYLFRGNDVYDPDYTGIGHSALGLDQWANLYTYFRVHASKIKIDIVNTSQSCQVGVVPSTQTNSPTTLQTLIEQPYSKYINIASLQGDIKSVSNYQKTKTVYGIESIEYEDNFTGTGTTGTVTNTWYWVILTNTFDSLTTMTMWINVRVVYWVEFFNRVELPPSIDNKETEK